MKSPHFLFFCALMGPCHAQTIFLPAHFSFSSIKAAIAAKRKEGLVEFAFDIHKVLIHKMPKKQLSTFWHSAAKWEILQSIFHPRLLGRLLVIGWQAFINVQPWLSSYYQEINAEYVISSFRAAHENKLADLFTTIFNTQKVDPAMMSLIKELKEKGYTLRVASNIGTAIFEKLKEHLELNNENIFQYFDKDAHNREGKTINYAKSLVQKPNPRYYHEYQQAYNPERRKIIIFIDDKFINIPPAAQEGFIGIHFKNAPQLRHDLTRLGIFEG